MYETNAVPILERFGLPHDASYPEMRQVYRNCKQLIESYSAKFNALNAKRSEIHSIYTKLVDLATEEAEKIQKMNTCTLRLVSFFRDTGRVKKYNFELRKVEKIRALSQNYLV